MFFSEFLLNTTLTSGFVILYVSVTLINENLTSEIPDTYKIALSTDTVIEVMSMHQHRH